MLIYIPGYSFFVPRFAQQKLCSVLIIDEIYVKASLTYSGGDEIFGYAVDTIQEK